VIRPGDSNNSLSGFIGEIFFKELSVVLSQQPASSIMCNSDSDVSCVYSTWLSSGKVESEVRKFGLTIK
jgi:hypothetical protein